MNSNIQKHHDFCHCVCAEIEPLQEAIRQVRELHYEYIGECVVCGDGLNGVPYPCPTIKALDGEQT